MQADNLVEDVFHRTQFGSVAQRALQGDADDEVSAHLQGYVHGIVVDESAVHQHHAIEVDGREHAGDGHAGAHRRGKDSLMEDDFGAVHDVLGDAGEGDGQAAEVHRVLIAVRQGGEQLRQVLAFDDSRIRHIRRFQGERDGKHVLFGLQAVVQQFFLGIGTIGQEELPVLHVHQAVQLFGGIADGIQAADNGAHAGAYHIVDGNTRLFYHFQGTDMRCALCTAAT